MLSIETEARVAKLFLTLADGEKAVEINRQVLSDQLDFDPYMVFKRLDTRGKNSIDEFDIVDFLKVNSVYCTYNEARFIILFYDRDADGCLEYSEFLNLVLSDYNYTLRRLARERVGYLYNRLTLPYDVEYSLSKLFERELDLVRGLEVVLGDVKSRYDFNVYELFSSIQSYSNLTSENIRKFLVRNGAEVTEGDVQAILKRFDINQDSRITFNEFKKIFSFTGEVKNQETNYKSFNMSRSTLYDTKKTLESPMRRTVTPDRYYTTQRFYSPNRSHIYYSPNRSMRVASPLRETYSIPIVSRSLLRSPIRTQTSTVRSPMRTTRSPIRTVRSPMTTVRSPLRTNVLNKTVEDLSRSRVTPNLSMTSSTNFKSTYPLVTYEEENFLNFLKDLVIIENELERSKSDLVLRSDFNVEDAFRIFELDGRGYLTDLDLKYGLNALDIFPTQEEITLLIKRYDSRREGIISYVDFFDVVAPLDREYRRMLENRLPSSSYVSRFIKPDVFLPTTKLYLQNLFNLLLTSEARVEGWRQRLQKLPRFNARLNYEKIDRFENGYFNETDVINYFNRNNVSYLNRDVDLILLRFDFDRDGRVSYLEFSDELYPKSTQFFSI